MGVALGPRQHPSTSTLKQPTAPGEASTTGVGAPVLLPTVASTPTPPTDAFDGVVGSTKRTGTTAVGDVSALPLRRLPPLREALVDPLFPTLSLSQVAVPRDVVDVLAAAKKVLVIGHARPADGDCVGSALGLMRGLKALGKDAVAVVDQDLPASLRALDPEQQVKRAKDVLGQDFDLVVLVDVAQAGRTGDMVDVVKTASNVLVVDHHDEPDARAALGLGQGARLTTWIDVDFDAAAGQVGAAVHAVAKATGGDVNGAVQAAAFVVAAGLYTDTLGFTAPGADVATLSLFKGLAVDVLGGGNATSGLAVLDGLEGRLAARLPDDVKARLDDALVARERRGPLGAERVLGVKVDILDDALATMRRTDPRAVVGDLTGGFLDAVDQARVKAGCGHALLVMPGDAGGWRVSVRGDAALEIGRRLSAEGGGKPGAAVALLSAEQAPTLEDAMALAARALSDHTLTASALMRVGR